MKHTIKSALRLTISIYVGVIWALVASANAQSVSEKQAVKMFESEVQEYVKLRNRVRENVPKLPKEATPEQIHTFMMAFQDATRAARSGAKPGEIFKPAVSEATIALNCERQFSRQKTNRYHSRSTIHIRRVRNIQRCRRSSCWNCRNCRKKYAIDSLAETCFS